MKKKTFFLLIILLYSFFVSLDMVNAEEKKVYWKIGGIESNNFQSIPYFFSKGGYTLNEPQKIVFNNILESGKTILDFDYSTDVSLSGDNSVILGIKQDTIYIQYSGILSFNSNSSYAFKDMETIKSVEGLSNVDTSEVTSMIGLFYGMKQLHSLDLSSFDTSNVTNMTSMFENCEELKDINLTTFNTSKLNSVKYMFNGVNEITDLDLSSFDLSMLEYNSCINFLPQEKNLITLKTPIKISTRCTVSLYDTFMDESNKTYSYLVANKNLTKAYTISYKGAKMYQDKIKYVKHGSETYGELIVPTLEITHNRPYATFDGWYKEPEFITKVTADTKFENSDIDLYAKFLENTQLAVSFSELLNGYTPATNTECSSLFVQAGGYCHSPFEDYIDQIEKIKHSDTLDNSKEILTISSLESDTPIYAWLDNNTLYFYTESEKIFLTNKTYSFSDLEKIKELDLSKFDTSRLSTISSMFSRTLSLTELDLSNFDTTNVLDMSYMFRNSSIRTLDLSNFNTSKVSNMEYMFFGMDLEKLDLSNFDTSNVTSMSYMFYASRSLNKINLSSFNTSKVRNIYRTFGEMNSLKFLDLSNFDLTSVIQMNAYNVFQGTKLDRLIAPKAINENISISLDYYFVVENGTARKNIIDSRIPSQATLNLSEQVQYYYVIDSSDVPTKYVSYGNKYGELYEPTTAPEGYVFDGWYAESGLVNKVTDTTIFDNNVYTKSLYAKWIEAPKSNFLNANTVSFKDNLSLNFLAEISDDELDGAYVIFKYTHYGEDVEITLPVNENDKHGNYYRFRCELTASEMMVNVVAELYLKNSIKPVSTWTRSIRDYIVSGLNNPEASDAEKALFRATLNYGGYTQKRFNYNGAPYAYEDYMDDVTNINILSEINFIRPEGFINGIKYIGSSVFFRNAPYVRYYFELENGSDISNYTFKIGNTIIVPTLKDNRYYIESTPSLAYELDKEQQVVITKDNLNVIDLDYSIIKWAEIAVANTTNEDESNMAKAMYMYYLAAKTFVESNS